MPLTRVADARAADPGLSGPFAGAPFLVKDLGQEYAGFPTSNGSRALENDVAEGHVASGDRCRREFHQAMTRVPRPALLDGRTDRWFVADQIAWDERDSCDLGGDRDIAMLIEHRHPIDMVSQVIHGDLTGNVLLHPQLPPAVIDLSPYWRPALYASAMVLADALLWHHAGEELVRVDAQLPDLAQVLVRAMLSRLMVQPQAAVDRSAQRRAVRLACELVESAWTRHAPGRRSGRRDGRGPYAGRRGPHQPQDAARG
jgi:hypothetical protein